MDTDRTLHPTSETLQAYGLGKLDDASAEAVYKHLEDCPDCRHAVAEMEPDSFLGRLRDAQAGSPQVTRADDDPTLGPPTPGASPMVSDDTQSIAVESSTSSGLQRGTFVGYFGDYELQRVLGEGGMGIVYKARQLSLNRAVALKMIRAARFPSADEVHRFQNEAEAVARLDHPNIVPIFEVGRFEDQHYFSMKLIAGTSLDKQLKDHTADPRRAARLVAVAAGAIHHAHQRGILHRDLKPANILVDADGHPHVTDFGLAKRVEGDSELTRSGAIVGTPAYMAPEQASAKKGTVTTATDVHGLGAILYALLTGRAPFGGTTVLDTLEQVRERPPELPRKLNPRVSRDLEVICLKCLEKDPRRRYVSADSLAEELKRWLAGEPIAARPVGNAARFWMWCRRNPVVAGAAGLVVSALVVVAVLSLLYAHQQNQLGQALTLYAEVQNRRADEQAEATVKISGLAKNLEKESHDLKAALVDSNRRLAMLFFERAQRAFDSDQVNVGLIWLIECWRHAAEADDLDWQSLARANLSFWRYNSPELKGVFPHHAAGTQPVFSPDGRTILTKSESNVAVLWDVATGRTLGVALVHEANISCMEFSPDGKTVVTGSADKTARLWDASTGRPLGQALKHEGNVNSALFSPNGVMVLTGSKDRMARLWNAATGQRIGESMEHRVSVTYVAFSPDGETILSRSDDGMTRLWDTAGRHVGKPIDGGSFVTYSSGGRVILMTSHGEVRLWDPATAEFVGEPMVQKGDLVSAAFSPDDKTVVTRSTDRSAQLWDASTGRLVGQPLEHQAGVSSVAFSPDGKTVLTGAHDCTARLWDVATTRPIGRPMLHQSEVISSKFSPDGKTILTGSDDNTARIWDANTAQPIGQALEHRGSVRSVVFSPNGQLFLTVGERTDRSVRLWSTTTGSPVSQPVDDPDMISAAAFGNDGKTVITVSYRNIGRFWDLTTFRRVGLPTRLWNIADREPTVDARLKHQIRSVSFSPDDKALLTWNLDSTATLWNTKSGEPIMIHSNANSVAFSPDGKIIIIGSQEASAQLWDSSTGRSSGSVLEHSKGPVWTIAFSPDSKRIVTGGEDEAARLWDVATASPVGGLMMHQGRVIEAAFLPDGRTIITRSAEMIRLWSTSTNEPIGQPFVPPRAGSIVAFNVMNKTILTRSADDRMRLWDAVTAQPIGPPLGYGGSIDTVEYSPDGKTIVTASASFGTSAGHAKSKVRMWHLPAILDNDLTRVTVWVETITGLNADDRGNIHSLDSESWRARRERLNQLGGPPKTDTSWLFLPSPPLWSGPERALPNPHESGSADQGGAPVR